MTRLKKEIIIGMCCMFVFLLCFGFVTTYQYVQEHQIALFF
ncbi:hypothetical protein [Kurthia senegalensis]|nr:hypothetical protein [Kurthia senegalensis]